MAKIDRKEAIEQVKSARNAPKRIPALKEELERVSDSALLRAKAYKDLIEMRRKWSTIVLGLLVIIVISDVALAWATGFGWLKFAGEYDIPSFVATGLLKTIGLAVIIVLFLFNKDSLKF